MLAIFVSWLAAVLVFSAFGKLSTQLFDFNNQKNYGLVDIFFMGFCFVGTILSLISLWFPLNKYVLLVLVLFSICYWIFDFIVKKQVFLLKRIEQSVSNLPFLYQLAIGLFAVALIVYTLLPPLAYDTGLYHWQAMKWIESYPVVPGLGNIHGRFGFNSNALLLHSVFSLQYIFGFRIFALHSLLMLGFLVWLVYRIKEKGIITQLIMILLFFVFLRYYDTFISSPGTDIMPNLIVVFLLLKIVFDKDSLQKTPLLYAILPAFCLTLKLSTAPICLLTLVVLIGLFKAKQHKIMFSFLASIFLIIAFWCARNVIISGYLIYPLPLVDLFNVDWKVPISLVQREKEWVATSAKIPGVPSEEVLQIPVSVWIKHWIIRHLNSLKMIFSILCLAGISPFVVGYAIKRKLQTSLTAIYPWLIALCGTMFWATTAPDVRFGLGFILIMALTPLLMLHKNQTKKIFKSIAPIILSFSALFFLKISMSILKNTKEERTYLSYLYKPQTIDYMINEAAPQYIAHKVGDSIIYVVINVDRCFDQALPCSTKYCFSDDLELRGKSIREGFRVKTNK